jgi:hypothetical protein
MATSSNQRRVTRFTVEPMYSSVSVTHGGRDAVDGHVYEVGLGGVRLELDEPLPNRASVDLAITLPGCNEAIAARGRVVEVYDAADDPGPRRMVVEFESFKEGAEATLERYLSQKWLRRAPEPQHAPRESQQEAPRDPQRTESPRARTSASASASSRKAKSASAA